MAEADETFGFDAEGVERIVDAVRKVEQMAPRVRLQRRRSVVISDGRNVKLGVLDGDCTSGGTATMSVWDGAADTGDDETVNNWYSSTVTSGTKVMAAWVNEAQGWYIMSADCTP